MADIDLTFIGTELRRLQHDMRELRIRVDYNNSEGRALSDVLREEMGRNIAGLHARMDAFDQRFTYIDETMSHVRQDASELRQHVNELRQGMKELRQEMTEQRGAIAELRQEVSGLRQDVNDLRQDVGEIKALLLAGRAG